MGLSSLCFRLLSSWPPTMPPLSPAMWDDAESLLTLAGEFAIVFCMSFVGVYGVLSLASDMSTGNSEREGHEDEHGALRLHEILRRSSSHKPASSTTLPEFSRRSSSHKSNQCARSSSSQLESPTSRTIPESLHRSLFHESLRRSLLHESNTSTPPLQRRSESSNRSFGSEDGPHSVPGMRQVGRSRWYSTSLDAIMENAASSLLSRSFSDSSFRVA